MKKSGINWNKFCAFVAILTVFAGSLAVVSLHLYTGYYLYPQVLSQENEINKYESLILADLHQLEKFPVLKQGENKNDASSFLQNHIPLVGRNIKRLENKQNQKIEELFNKYPKWASDKTNMNSLINDPLLTELDPKWLESLLPFDHWAYSNQAEVQKIIQDSNHLDAVEKIAVISTLPIPDYVLLKNWALIYVIKKVQLKDLQTGLKTYRKVAELINSSGSLVAQMHFVSMVKAEHMLMNNFQGKNWNLIALSSIDAYRRLSWAWVHLAQLPFYSELNAKFKNYTKPEYGICAGATENLLYIFTLRDYLEPQFLFEKEFTKNYAHIQQFQQSAMKNCSLNNFNQFAEYSSLANQNLIVTSSLFSFLSTSSFIEKLTPWLGQLNWSYIPFVRRFLALKYYTVAMPQFLTPYRDFAGSKTKPNE